MARLDKQTIQNVCLLADIEIYDLLKLSMIVKAE